MTSAGLALAAGWGGAPPGRLAPLEALAATALASGMVCALALAGWALAALAGAWSLALRRRLAHVARAEHELRSPLAALALAAEAARRRAVPASRADLLAGALDAQLPRARAGLDDLAAARRGRRRVARPAAVPLGRLVRACATGWDPVARASGRRIAVDWRAGAATVRADRGRLAQAIGNLLANAIEHGDAPVVVRGRRLPGRVRVEFAPMRENTRPAQARAGTPVAESGPRRPRPAQEEARATPVAAATRERRVRASRPHGGARGHGLAVAARAVDEAGGRLTVSDDAGGLRLAIELPVEL